MSHFIQKLKPQSSMKTEEILSLLLFSVLAVGCKSVQQIGANTPAIVIKQPEHRPTVLGGSVEFPVGIYSPDFQTDKGVYYLAPTKLVVSGLGMHRPKRGGLFVPHPNDSDQRQAMWLDQESTTRLWRFKKPVLFEIENPE